MEQQPQQAEEERENEVILELPPEIQPRIYVASLSDYNAGRLYGIWLEADQDPEELHDAITGMLCASPMGKQAEEWAIHDFEGFNGLHLGEWEDLKHVSRVAKGIVEHGIAFAHWTMAAEDEELDKFEEAYLGHWPSMTDYALDLLDDYGIESAIERDVPESLQPYIKVDAEALGRDLELGGDVSTFEGDAGVYVFRAT
jgi:antirestriction protein